MDGHRRRGQRRHLEEIRTVGPHRPCSSAPTHSPPVDRARVTEARAAPPRPTVITASSSPAEVVAFFEQLGPRWSVTVERRRIGTTARAEALEADDAGVFVDLTRRHRRAFRLDHGRIDLGGSIRLDEVPAHLATIEQRLERRDAARRAALEATRAERAAASAPPSWRRELDRVLRDETPTARTRRQARARRRRRLIRHVPRGNAAVCGATTSAGRPRHAAPVRRIVALWGCGFGVRPIGELLDVPKSVIGERLQEAEQPARGCQAVEVAELVDEHELGAV